MFWMSTVRKLDCAEPHYRYHFQGPHAKLRRTSQVDRQNRADEKEKPAVSRGLDVYATINKYEACSPDAPTSYLRPESAAFQVATYWQ